MIYGRDRDEEKRMPTHQGLVLGGLAQSLDLMEMIFSHLNSYSFEPNWIYTRKTLRTLPNMCPLYSQCFSIPVYGHMRGPAWRVFPCLQNLFR